jgi:hypothetical protein
MFHFRRAAYSAQLKSKCGNLLAKTATFRINLNLGGVPITSKSHTHPSHSETSRPSTSSLFLFSVSRRNWDQENTGFELEEGRERVGGREVRLGWYVLVDHVPFYRRHLTEFEGGGGDTLENESDNLSCLHFESVKWGPF